MKKIAIITPGFLPVPAVEGGAVENLIQFIIEENEKKKVYEFEVISIKNKVDDIDISYKYSNFSFISLNFTERLIDKFLNKIYSLLSLQCFSSFYIRKVKKLMKKHIEEYDAILIENNMFMFEKIYNTFPDYQNYYFHLHNDILDNTKPKRLCQLIIKNSKKIITVSDYIKKRMESIEGDKDNLVTLYNSIDLSVFNCSRFNKNDFYRIRGRLNINKDDFLYIYTGRICDEKGVLELVNAFYRLSIENQKCKLLIVGNSWFNKKQKTKFEKKLTNICRKISERIVFVGFIPYNVIPEMLFISDCVVIPSKWEEPFGMVSIEALAMKKMIISTNVGGLGEILNKNIAIMVDKENLEVSLYNAMLRAWKDIELRKKLENNADNFMRENKQFSKTNYFNGMVEILK